MTFLVIREITGSRSPKAQSVQPVVNTRPFPRENVPITALP